MSFTAWYYPLFLAAVAALYWHLPQRGRLALVLLASYAFYGVWDLRFLALIGASTVMDFLCAQAIAGERRPRAVVLGLASLPLAWCIVLGSGAAQALGIASVPSVYLPVAVAAACGFVALYEALWRLPAGYRPRAFLALQIGYSAGILFFFKYFGFFVDSARRVLAAAGLGGDFTVVEVLLPVGISFYTFQSIAYAVDVYRRRVEPCRDALTFAAFIAFFPQLVAGPIERAAHLLPQIVRPPAFDWAFVRQGVSLILVGLFKKVYVANNCALVADHVFKGDGYAGAGWILVATVAFAFQIYGDFSGYTDIARGSARLLGVRLAENFRLPYLARGPSEFWQRWHISLSTWIRDYLYIPLGGNRGSPARTLVNLYVAMLLAGLWHGAAWTFIVWGAYHATLLALYRTVPPLRALEAATGVARVPAIALMFAFTLLGWLIFRAPDIGFVGHALGSLVGVHGTAAVPASLVNGWRGASAWLALHVVPLAVLEAVLAQARRRDDALAATPNVAHAIVDGGPVVARFAAPVRYDAPLAHRAWGWRVLDYAVLLLLVGSSAVVDQEFIYFQF